MLSGQCKNVSADGANLARITARWFAGLQVDGILTILSTELSREDSMAQVEYMVNLLTHGLDSIIAN